MIWRILDIELVDTLTNRKWIKRMTTDGNEMAKWMEKSTLVDNSKKTNKRVLKK